MSTDGGERKPITLTQALRRRFPADGNLDAWPPAVARMGQIDAQSPVIDVDQGWMRWGVTPDAELVETLFVLTSDRIWCSQTASGSADSCWVSLTSVTSLDAIDGVPYPLQAVEVCFTGGLVMFVGWPAPFVEQVVETIRASVARRTGTETVPTESIDVAPEAGVEPPHPRRLLAARAIESAAVEAESTDLEAFTSRPGRGQPRGPRSAALLVLEVFVWLLAVIPARLVFPQIGYFGSPASLVGLVAFALWTMGAVRPELLPRKVVAVRVAVVVFWLGPLISFAVLHLNAVPTDELNSADRWILFSIVWSGLALLAAEGLHSREEALRLLRVIVAGASFSAAVAIAQSELHFDFTVWTEKIPLLSVDGTLDSILSRGGLDRPAGTASHPIEFGVMLCMVLGFALVLAFHDQGWAPRRRWLALGLIGLAIPIAISRSAIIGGVIVLFVWMFGANGANRRRTAYVLVIGAIGVFMTSPGLIGTLLGYFSNAGSDDSITSRTSDYAAIAQYVRRSPLIGRGPATFLPKYRILDNTWLTFTIEVGLVGVVGLLTYYLTPQRLGRMIRRASADPMLRAIGLALIGLSVILVVESATFDFYAYPMDPGFLALLIGIGGALTACATTEPGTTGDGSTAPIAVRSRAGPDPAITSGAR